MERKVQRILTHPVPLHVHSLPHYQHPPPEGTFVTTEDPTLTHHHPQPTGSMSVHSRWCMFYSLDTCVMACIHHGSTTQNRLTALKTLCAPLYPSPQTLAPTNLSLSPWFSLPQDAMQLDSYSRSPFRLALFTYSHAFKVSRFLSVALVAHFFLALNYAPSSGCPTACPFPCGRASWLLQILAFVNGAAVNVCGQGLVWMCVFSFFGRNHQLPPRVAAPLCTPPAKGEHSCCCTSSPASGVSSVGCWPFSWAGAVVAH